MTYVEAVKAAGAIPLLIPPQSDALREVLERLDGVILAGGDDCDPRVYGAEPHPSVEPMDARRQSNDLALARLSRELAVPTLGICLGLQVMNVAAGGSLIQDIASQVDTDIRHASEPEDRHRHDVIVERATRLGAILPKHEIEVNSSHHQAVDRVGQGLRVTAHAADGVVEGLEDPDHPFYVGVQWHPEDMAGEESAAALWAAFIEAARRRAAGRAATDLSPAGATVSE
jgi:putative glutamine amidotransferase